VRSEAQSVLSRVAGLWRTRRTPSALDLPGLASSAALTAATEVSRALLRVREPEAVARILLDETARIIGVPFAFLVVVSEDGAFAHGLLGRSEGRDLDWVHGLVVDLEREPSGIASAVFEGAPFSVYDVASSSVVSQRLASLADATSAAFIPIVAEGHVIAVLVAGETRRNRAFTGGEIALLTALGAEGALALERARKEVDLEEALERERLIARISLKLRAELRLDDATRLAVEEAGRALAATRCFLRLGPADAPLGGAEWHAEGLEPLGDRTVLLPAPPLAMHERRTIVIVDPETDARIDEEGRALLRSLGTRSVLAVPIELGEEVLGAIGFHRARPGDWPEGSIALAEGVARELGTALRATRLLEENERRLAHQAALLAAAQTLTSELSFEAVLERLVDEVVRLLRADAADCWLLDETRRTLRCVAVHGLPESEVGRRIEPGGTVAEALSGGRPVLNRDFQAEQPSENYRGFAEAMDAPISTRGEIRGVFGVCSREPGRFDEADLELLDAFANLVSLALQNAEAFEDRSRQARIQQGFYRIAAVLGEPLSLEETYEAVAHAAAMALGGSSAALLMPRGDEREVVGGHELPLTLRATLAGSEPGVALALAADERRIVAAPDLAADERFDVGWRQAAGAAGVAALLAVPVESPRSGGAGLALVLCDEPREFTDEDVELARHLADAARGALERSQLFEAERTSRALAQQLARTGGLLATELDPEAVLLEVAQQARMLLGADACTIALLEGDELVVSAAAALADDAEAALGARASTTEHFTGDVAQSRLPVTVSSVEKDRRGTGGDPFLEAGHLAYLGVPLVGPEGGLHGVLAVYSRRPRAWQAEEVDALLALAGNTSAALSNAELYQRVAVEKERSFAILANIADGIVAVDREGMVVLWNAAAEQITGVPAVEALGRAPAQVLSRSLDSEGDAPSGDRLVSINRGDEEVWLSLTEAVMRDPAGAVAGRIFAFRDISADRLVEQMKSDFVSTVSHELRTPLTSIYGFSETLLRRDVLFDEEERRVFIGYIASESERLTAIVDALLNVARLDTGDLQVNLGPMDMRPVLDEVVSGAKQEVHANGHRFVLDVPPEPLTAEADREKVRQVLQNLLENAVKYSPGGGTVTVEARRGNDTIEVRVVDQGIGIPRLEQERIFRKFYRAEATAQGGSGGTGLGLFIAQGLVAAMGGRIWVDSTEGEGSSFGFALPLARD
jgi:PAS domain S-box-containing protein